MSKKKKDDTKKAVSKATISKSGKELSEDQLEQVSGGALNAYIKLDGTSQGTVQGSTSQLKIDLKID